MTFQTILPEILKFVFMTNGFKELCSIHPGHISIACICREWFLSPTSGVSVCSSHDEWVGGWLGWPGHFSALGHEKLFLRLSGHGSVLSGVFGRACRYGRNMACGTAITRKEAECIVLSFD